MNALDTWKEITHTLQQHGIDAAEKDAGLLVSHGLEIPMLAMYRDNPPLGKEQIQTLEGMAWRRMKREPLQYILGHDSFLDLNLMVGPGVLIPRPETEFMAEHAIALIKKDIRTTGNPSLAILDLCTGSGCLALSLAKAFPDATVCGTDVSEAALAYAARNAEMNELGNVSFFKGSLFHPLKRVPSPAGFDLIISNPPYVRTGDIEGLQPEIRDWEPRIALDGGPDGLDAYRKIVPKAGRFLRKGGRIMLEVGSGQAQSVADICVTTGYARTEILRDLSGIERIVQARWKK